MRVSVVLCEHSMERYDDFTEAASAVLSQTHDDVELVIVIDGNEVVYERAVEDFADRNDVIVQCNDENRGLLTSRNRGSESASGDVVAFIDDDAVPAEDWVELLVEGYQEQNAIAVGGRMTPRWVAGKPSYLPAEFYWLVGVTQRGFADGPCEVRNTFGSNISFRRDIFLELGGFETDVGGRKGDANLQGGETELCARLRDEYGQGVWYLPSAEVEHKVFAYRTDVQWLLSRAFWQGYSKRGMEVFVEESTDEEFDFLGQLVTEFVPRRIKGLVSSPSVEKVVQFVMVFVFTAVVGFGYLYGLVTWRGRKQ